MTAGCPNRQRRHTPSSWTTPNPDTTLLGLYFQQPARRSDFYPKAQITQTAVQKKQVVVQKMQVKQLFSFVLLLKEETNVRRKESSHEKVRSMPWKAGIGRPLP